MKLKQSLLVAISVVLLAACAGPRVQPLQATPQGKSGYVLSQSVPVEPSHTVQYLDGQQCVVYSQNFGGGGAGLGVMLGPLGVAANISMIESNTKKDADMLRNKIDIAPREVFLQAAKQSGFDLADSTPGSRYGVTPYLYISKTDGEALLVSSALLVEQGGASTRYMYQLPVRYSIDELSHLDQNANTQLKAEAERGYATLLKYLSGENGDKYAQEQNVTFKSDFLNPRFNFEMAGTLLFEDDQVMWIKTFGGVFAVQKSNISIYSRKS